MWVANIGAALTKANEFKSRKSVIRLTKVRIGSSPIAHNAKKEWFTRKIGRGDIVKEFRNTDEITKEDLEKMYNAIVKFDNYISSATRKPTDENIGLYEHWIDCRYDIENLIVTER